MVSGSAPGRLAETWMVGKSTSGSGATGNSGYAMMPTKRMPTISNDVAMGSRMNGPELPPARSVRRAGLGLSGRAVFRHGRIGRSGRLLIDHRAVEQTRL